MKEKKNNFVDGAEFTQEQTSQKIPDIKEYISQSIKKTKAKNGGVFTKVDADTAENIDWLQKRRKNAGKELQKNTDQSADCGSKNAVISFKDQFFCKSCADFLMEKLKRQYYTGKKELDWDIQELWDQLRDPADLLTGNAEFFLEADELSSNERENNVLYYRSLDAKSLFRAFVREKLDGDLQKFKDFDLETLKNDEFFGCDDPEDFDCDNTYIIRAVYVLLWSKVFPDITDWREIGTGKCYRGDTINTFHTIFGRKNLEKPGHFKGIDKFSPDDILYDRIRCFYKKIHTLGNYTVLPNASVKTDKGFVTLNTYRGTNRWQDYFDQFLLALEPCLSSNSKVDETLFKLVHEHNRTAFAGYKSQEGFTRLAKNLLLDDYLDSDGHAKNLFADTNGKVFFHWERPQPSRDWYLEGVINYLDHAEKIISNRAERMIGLLQEFC